MTIAGFIFACIGCAATLIAGYIASRDWRKRRRYDRVERAMWAQVGANAEWLRDSCRRQSHGEAQSRTTPDVPAPDVPALFVRGVAWFGIYLGVLSWLAFPFLILALRDWTLISVPLMGTVLAATCWRHRREMRPADTG